MSNKINLRMDKSWIYLERDNGENTAYPILGGKEKIEKEIDDFARDLKAALLGKKIGEISLCRSCEEKIEYVGPYWRHVNSSPRHPAIPFGEKP